MRVYRTTSVILPCHALYISTFTILSMQSYLHAYVYIYIAYTCTNTTVKLGYNDSYVYKMIFRLLHTWIYSPFYWYTNTTITILTLGLAYPIFQPLFYLHMHKHRCMSCKYFWLHLSRLVFITKYNNPFNLLGTLLLHVLHTFSTILANIFFNRNIN